MPTEPEGNIFYLIVIDDAQLIQMCLTGDDGRIKCLNGGDSAYQITVKSGFVGTAQAWLVSLKGTDGEDGTAGAFIIEQVAGLSNALDGKAGKLTGLSQSNVIEMLYCDGDSNNLDAFKHYVLTALSKFGAVNSTPTITETVVYAIDCGRLVGSVVEGFSPDNYYTDGNSGADNAAADGNYDLSLLSAPKPPEAIFDNNRFARPSQTKVYVFLALVPGDDYKVYVYFADDNPSYNRNINLFLN